MNTIPVILIWPILAAIIAVVARSIYPSLTKMQTLILALAVVIAGVLVKSLVMSLGYSQYTMLAHRVAHLVLAATLTCLAIARVMPAFGTRQYAVVVGGTVISVFTTLLQGPLLAWAIQGAIFGVTLAVAVRSANPAFETRHVALVTAAWALAMFLVAGFVYPAMGYPFEPIGYFTVERFITNCVAMATIVGIGGGATFLTLRRVAQGQTAHR